MRPLSRRVPYTRTIAFAIVLFVFIVFVYRAFNPADINKIVLLIESPATTLMPEVVALDGDVKWEQSFKTSGVLGPAKSTSLHVADVHKAWFDGTVTLKDKGGKVIASAPISPRGRYGGTLVVLIDAHGQSHMAWNEIPDTE